MSEKGERKESGDQEEVKLEDLGWEELRKQADELQRRIEGLKPGVNSYEEMEGKTGQEREENFRRSEELHGIVEKWSEATNEMSRRLKAEGKKGLQPMKGPEL